MRHQPARAFGHEGAERDDEKREHAADNESETPAEPRRKQGGIENDDRTDGAERRADPIASVHIEIDAPAIARRHEFLDRGIDRRILAADPCAGQRAEEREGEEIPGEARGDGGDEVDADGDREEPLAAELVREVAEEERTEDRTDEIGAGSKPDLFVRKTEARPMLRERAG